VGRKTLSQSVNPIRWSLYTLQRRWCPIPPW